MVTTIIGRRQRSAANTQLEVKTVVWLRIQLGRNVSGVRFLLNTSMAADTILGTAYINVEIKSISLKDCAQNFTGLSSVAIEESIGKSACIANIENKKLRRLEEDQRK